MRFLRAPCLQSILKKIWILFAVAIIFLALLSSAFRAMSPFAKQYKGELETRLSTFLGEKVSIGDMETVWYWFEPLLQLKDIKIANREEQKPAISVKKLLIGLNLFRSLIHRELQPDIIYADGVNVSFRQSLDKNQHLHWQIVGLDLTVKPQEKATSDAVSYHSLLLWALTRQKLIFQNVTGNIYHANQTVTPVKKFDLFILQGSGHYKLKALTYLWDEKTPFLEILADIIVPSSKDLLHDLKAKAYIAAHDINFMEVQDFLPKQHKIPLRLQQGRGDLSLWVDWKKGRVQSLQSKINARQLKLEDLLLHKQYYLPYLAANTAFSQSKTGWELSADHLKMAFAGKIWPENKFFIRKHLKKNELNVYAEHLLIEPLIKVFSPFFTEFDPYLALKPSGLLEDTQINLSNGKLSYLLTRFSNLSWAQGFNKHIPGVENLKGMLHWQPTEGLLELDSKKVVIKPEKAAAIFDNRVSLILNWKQLSHGLRLHLDNLVLENGGLLVSGRGYLDEVSANSLGLINLNAQVSAKETAKIYDYLPLSYWETSSGRWIKENIKNPGSMAAEIKVQGAAKDFPFDTTPGEFKINAHVSGVNLLFAKNWPLTSDFEGYLQLDKRKLDVDVVHANLQDITISNGNFRIDELGKGQEVFLLHTNIDASLEETYAYLKASPLARMIKNIKDFKGEGNINLNLNLEVPLYPENNNILALGEIRFNDNQIQAKFGKEKTFVALDALNGSMRFDEASILDGNVKASFMGYPLNAVMESVLVPERKMQITMHGKSSMDVVQKQIDYPPFALMKGEFWFDSEIAFTYKPNGIEKNYQFKSSLQGVGIHMPAPFNKSEETSAPISLSLTQSPDNQWRFRMNYNNQFSTDLAFKRAQDKVSGQIRFGRGDALWKPESGPGVQVLGQINKLNMAAWQKILASIPVSEITRLILNATTKMDIMIDSLEFAHRVYPNMNIKGKALGHNEWSLTLDQKNILADLRIIPEKNTIQGHFKRLYIDKIVENTSSHATRVHSMKAKDMPNIHWQIDDLKYGDWSIGAASIEGVVEGNNWRLTQGQISTESYAIFAKGLWNDEEAANHSQLEANMTISSLAKTLEFWNITPVVDAAKGKLDFKGEWKGALQDFSLQGMKGELNILFKDGQISHLDPETEKKLGFGKLLSILSLQTLPRRLKLDFSDLSSKGYSFDEFKGNFKIEDGLMTTSNSFINGPIAYVAMNGMLDISRQLYDMTLKVTPYVTANLPIVVTIAGSPVAGIATWVASKIINKGMQKVMWYTYKITGPWKHPLVQQAGISKKS